MSTNAVSEMTSEVSDHEFHSLEEKIFRTIELLKAAREGKAAAERDVKRVREQLELREEEVDTLRKEMIGLRKEREDVKTRVEKILSQIDEITEESGE